MSRESRDVYNHHWRKVRLEVLIRDEWLCQIRGPKCKGTADQADHVIDWRDGGPLYDPANLRASCGPCNIGRVSEKKARQGWTRSQTLVTLVMGPPGSGKSTYVRQQSSPGDVVVDYDLLAQTLTGEGHGTDKHTAVMAARNAVLRQIRRGDLDAKRAWIVSANPQAREIFPSHEVVELDPGLDECLRRCAEAGRPASFGTVVRDWYSQHVNAQASSARRPSREW